MAAQRTCRLPCTQLAGQHFQPAEEVALLGGLDELAAVFV